jgi:hypothetical protein
MWESHRAELVSELDALINTRLFGPGNWLADAEAVSAIERKLHKWNLEERVPGFDRVTRATSLGKLLNVDLLMVFCGIMEPWDAVMILEGQGLLDEVEASNLYQYLAAQKDPDRLLRKQVQEVYRRYFQLRALH